MFKILKKKEQDKVYACVDGTTKALSDVADEAFSKGLLGNGIAIVPSNTTVVSPINGVIAMIFPTKHAIGLKSEDGLEILLHIGIDTVSLNGEGFDLLIKEKQKVKVGDPLVTVDTNLLKEKGICSDVMCIITSSTEVTPSQSNQSVKAGIDTVLQIESKK